MNYTENDIRNIVAEQRKFFRTGTTLPVKWRLQQLKKLKAAVIAHETEFEDALAKDLGRSKVEAYLCDVGPIIVEINEMLRGLRRWSRPERHFSGFMCFPSMVTKVYKMPSVQLPYLTHYRCGGCRHGRRQHCGRQVKFQVGGKHSGAQEVLCRGVPA